MLVSTFAIAGIFPFSGFFSKDAILFEIAKRSTPIYIIGTITSLMTAFYMFRLMYKTFYGSPKTEDAAHVHEAPAVMTLPLIILAVLATFAGALAIPAALHGRNYFSEFLAPAVLSAPGRISEGGNQPSELILLAVGFAIAIIGCAFAYIGYKIKDGRDLLLTTEQKPRNFVYQLLLNKWYVDEIYYNLFTVPGRMLSEMLYKTIDEGIVDGAVRAVASLAETFGSWGRSLQTGFVRDYGLTILVGAVIILAAVAIGFRGLF
jgi:NADH-quinone oxidoreductase subunit L